MAGYVTFYVELADSGPLCWAVFVIFDKALCIFTAFLSFLTQATLRFLRCA